VELNFITDFPEIRPKGLKKTAEKTISADFTCFNFFKYFRPISVKKSFKLFYFLKKNEKLGSLLKILDFFRIFEKGFYMIYLSVNILKKRF
jgi:hypothetical protein